MRKENAINSIRENLKRLLKFADEKFGNLVLSDGTQVTTTATDLEIGAEVFMLDDLGNQTPCEDGQYVLQDGRTFVCTGGKITDIMASEKLAEKPESGETTTDKPQTMAKDGMPEGQKEKEKMQEEGEMPEVEEKEEKEIEIEVKGVEVDKRVADLESQVAEILNILSKMGNSQNELNEQMMSAIKKFGAEPGDEPVKVGKKGYQNYESKVTSKVDASFDELKTLMKKRRSTF